MSILKRIIGKSKNTEQKTWDDLKTVMKTMNPGLMFIPGRTLLVKLAFRRFKETYEGGK